ncbi:MAG: sigma 54-interacting transcriptional regulator [Candidatus Schekmanbacteria bacterium]|nr:sigma 54-interacting transcriptional regulator [Candidatus Schekmanbacteria bacterium]
MGQEDLQSRLQLRALREATLRFADCGAGIEEAVKVGLDQLMRVADADCGVIALCMGPDEAPRIAAQRSCSGGDVASMTVMAEILKQGSPDVVIIEPPDSASVVEGSISAVLCAAVRRQGRNLGAVYLDRRQRPPFDELARESVLCFAAVLALALDLSRLLAEEERLRVVAEDRAVEARVRAAERAEPVRFGALMTGNREFGRRLAVVERAALRSLGLLLMGETGTGKEFLARCVHEQSPRRNGPFVAINCVEPPDTLFESELFGFERGAFTGAERRRIGAFELAAGGTLFLDEIGELPLALQKKLLRVLETKRVRRLGSSEEVTVDTRIIAATNRELAKDVQNGAFREDLFFRLNVLSVTIPPLRERPEDILVLADLFLDRARFRHDRQDLVGWEPAASRQMRAYSWPGNVRELEHAVERLAVMVDGPLITNEDVRAYVLGIATGAEASQDEGGARTLREILDDTARDMIALALREEGSLTAAARRLGLSAQSLFQRARRLGLR